MRTCICDVGTIEVLTKVNLGISAKIASNRLMFDHNSKVIHIQFWISARSYENFLNSLPYEHNQSSPKILFVDSPSMHEPIQIWKLKVLSALKFISTNNSNIWDMTVNCFLEFCKVLLLLRCQTLLSKFIIFYAKGK